MQVVGGRSGCGAVTRAVIQKKGSQELLTSHAVGSLAGGVQVVGGRSGCGVVNSGKGPGMVLGSKPGPGPTRRPVSLRPTAPCKL